MQEQLNQLYGYLHGMWRFRWSALVIAWVVALIGWLFVLTLPNQYQAGAIIYVDTTSIMKPLLKNLALEVDTQDELKAMNHMLLSRENLLTVIRETDMDLNLSNAHEKEMLIKRLALDIGIKGGGKKDKSGIYEIDYSGTSPQIAYKVVSVLLNNMIENTLSNSRTDAVTAQKFLDTQISEYEQRLSVAEQKLADFKKANLGFMPDNKGSYYARLQRAQDSIDQTRSQLRLARQRQNALEKQLANESPYVDGTGFGGSVEEKLRRYREELDGLLSVYTKQHPDVQSVLGIIEELEASLATEESDPTQKPAPASSSLPAGEAKKAVDFNPVYQELKVEVSKANVEVELLLVQKAEREELLERLKADIDVIPEVEAQLAKLNRDYEVTRNRYLSLVERRESAKLAQEAGQSSSDVQFRVIDPPIVPTRPSGPPRLLFLAGVLVVALGAGLAWSFLRLLLAPTFFDLKQVGNKIGLPVLGTVSLYLSPEHKRKRKLQLATFISSAFLLVVAFGGVAAFHEKGVAVMASMLDQVSQKVKEG